MARKAAAQVDPSTKPPEPAPVITEDVEVDLAPEETSAEPVTIETAPEPAEPEPKPAPPPSPPPEDPEKIALRQRLRELEQAETLSRQQLEEAQRGQRQSRQQLWQTQYDSVVNTLGAVQSQIDAATQELDGAYRAQAEGGPEATKRIAELNVTLGRLGAKLDGLESRKEAMDNQLEQWKRGGGQQQPQRQQQPSQQQQQPSLEQIISNFALPDQAKTWLRNHSQYVLDPVKAALANEKHYVAKHMTGEEWTPRYFDQLEILLGEKQEGKPNGGNGAQQRSTPQQRQSAAPVSAPPTREAPSMATGRAPQSTKISLTKEEREIAWATRPRESMTQAEADREYARNKQKMLEAKANGQIS